MTFSDAEEDQPSVIQSGNMSNGISDSSRGSSSMEVSANEAAQPVCDGQAACTNNNNQDSSSETLTINGHETPSGGDAPTSSSNTSGDSSNLNGTTSGGQDNEVSGPSTSQSSHLESTSVNSSSQNSLQFNTDSVVGVANNVKGLGNEKVMEKLQQIHGYIQQTAAAMEALEREGDLNKIGQYNTLVKCMRDLKMSESKLTSHLNKIKERSSKNESCYEESLLEQFEALYRKSKAKENEYLDILTRSLLVNVEPTSSGSESIGVVGSLDGGSHSDLISSSHSDLINTHRTPSMEERLARHESEQQQLSERLRESLVRREELMARYQATRERLNNLKRQRLGLVQEERKLLQSVGAPDNMYDNPIPGAESWTLEQLEAAIIDFHGLKDKVDRLFEAYTSKMQAFDGEESESRTDLQRKIDQVVNKKGQIENALNRLNTIIHTKRDAGEVTNTAEGEQMSEESLGNPDHYDRIPVENEVQSSAEDNSDIEGAAGVTTNTAEIESKQHHLTSLKDQLLSMRKLLQVTHENLPLKNEEINRSESVPKDDNLSISELELLSPTDCDDDEPLIDSTIVGVNGEVIHLSECERRNPHVVSKYRQLSEAKQRLAKMEEIMEKIAEARDSGRSLSEVLSPENLAILNEARSEEEDKTLGLERSTQGLMENNDLTNQLEMTSHEMGASDESLILRRRSNRDSEAAVNPPKVNELCKKRENPSNGKNKWEREREISAMQYHFKKKTPGIPSVNEGFKSDHDKGAIKKQTRELLNECGTDPRMMEVAALQEELKEKKNALEALMRRMGKSSSFIIDNISDNISENVSDLNSEIFEKPLASWGPPQSQSRYYSDPGQSDEEIMDANEEDLSFNVGATQAPLPPRRMPESQPETSSNTNTKNRNKVPLPPKLHSHSEHNRFSVNNLSDSLPKSVRPKQNRAAPGPVPVSSWENVSTANHPPSYSSPNNKVQNTVAAALSQLSQVQETINSLYGELRAAELAAARQQQEIPNLNPYANAPVFPQVPYILPQTYMPSYCISPLPNSQGRGDLGASNILASLQQCFSQLYLHSLEIQSLSKHLQIIDQREKSSSPLQTKLPPRSNSCDRIDRYPAGRITNENFSQNCPPRFLPNVQNSQHPHFENRKGVFPERRDILNSQSNETFTRTGGVSNPLYASLFNVQQAHSWQTESNEASEFPYGDKNLFHPYEASARDDIQQSNGNGEVVIDPTPHYPVDAEDLPDIPWSTMSNPQMRQQPSDILNNQVLPGTRANNYWDNFRSYSRQNPLSTTAKFNTGEHFPYSGSSTPSRRQSLNSTTRLQPPVIFENKKRHTNISSNNSINKASDKNSSSTRSQNKVGARMRSYAEQKESGRQVPSNSYRGGATGAANHQMDNVPYKRNNRHDYANEYEPETFNQLEISQSQARINNEGRPSNNARRIHTEGENISRNFDENSSARNLSVHSDKGATAAAAAAAAADGENASETFHQVIREAESLMEKHSQQPQFLLQLFHHAAKITRNTDQQVALDLLRELSYQRHRNNIQNNRWASNSSVTQSAQSDSISLPAHIRDTDNRNLRSSNKKSRSRGASGSDASESGLTSDEDETKILYQMVKNLPQTSSGAGIYPPLISSPQATSDNNPSSVGVSPIHIPSRTLSQKSQSSQNQRPQPELRKDFSKDIVNISTTAANKDRSKAENKQYGNRLQRKHETVENSARNYIPNATSCNSPVAPFNTLYSSIANIQPFQRSRLEESIYPIGDKHNNKRQMKKLPRRNLSKGAEEKSNFSLKNDKNFSLKVHPVSDEAKAYPVPRDDLAQESSTGFEALVSSSLREVLLCFENADYSSLSTPQILDALHASIMRQVQFHSSTLGFSTSFVSSIDSQLKATLNGFQGERLPSIRQELAAAVTQVLIQEYCSLFMQQDSAPNLVEGQALEAKLSTEPCLPKRSELESNNKCTIVPHVFKQTSSNSLFNSQSNVIKPARVNNTAWSFSPVVPSEQGLIVNSNVNSHPREEESKSNVKSKGAIAKNSVPHHGTSSSHRDESFFINQETKRESPFPEASSFPESWVVQRGSINSTDAEGVYSFLDSSFSREREERNILGVENLSYERNDAEADQEDHARNADFLNVSLPVHDLAEADQSQDPLEGDCADSSIENDQYEAASATASASSGHQEPKEYPLRLLPKKKVSSEQGLDEVPTRLLNAAERACSPGGRFYTDETNNRIPPPRIGHYTQQGSSHQPAASNHSHNDQNATHASESSSGIGG